MGLEVETGAVAVAVAETVETTEAAVAEAIVATVAVADESSTKSRRRTSGQTIDP